MSAPSGQVEPIVLYAPPAIAGKLVRYWWVSVLCALVVASASYAGAKAQKVTYKATAQVLVTQGAAAVVTGPNVLTTGDQATNISTQESVLASSTVKHAAEALLHRTPPKMSTSAGTGDVVDVSVQDVDPAFAAVAANAYVTAYLQVLNNQLVEQLKPAQLTLQQRVANLDEQISKTNDDIAAAQRSIVTTTSGSEAVIRLNAIRDQIADDRITSLEDQLQRLATILDTAQANLDRVSSTLSLGSLTAQSLATAETPITPASPTPARDAAVGAVSGLIVGAVISSRLRQRPASRRRRGAETSVTATSGPPIAPPNFETGRSTGRPPAPHVQ